MYVELGMNKEYLAIQKTVDCSRVMYKIISLGEEKT